MQTSDADGSEESGRAHNEQQRRLARQPWMVPVNPVLLVTDSGPKEIPAPELTGRLIGWKAFGLTCLPHEWTPPFFVIAASCFRSPSRLSEWIGRALAEKRLHRDQQVIVRSSGTAETMMHRGRLHSEACRSGEVLSTVGVLLARASDFLAGDVHWIVQEALAPVSKGHLSNERRVSHEGRDWLAQVGYLDDRGESTARMAVRNWRDGLLPAQRDLRCNSETEVTLCLKRVAMWASQYSSRTHFEWVWNGKSIGVVQSDREEPPAGTKPRDLLPKEVPSVHEASLRVFRRASEGDYVSYRKLANARLYGELGYSMPDFFVLDDIQVLKDLFGGIVGVDLAHDLVELTKRPLVIRTDGKQIPPEKYEMLPRTEDVRAADVAERWLTTTFTIAIQETKLTEASLCLVAHHFIPSVAAAWARAEPSSRMVRIESLWGLPEGLYWYAHDAFEVDTGDTQMEPDRSKAIRRCRLWARLRFKGTFIASDATDRKST